MDIAIPLYDRFTALDAIGPYEVLSRLPDSRVTFIGTEAGPYKTDNGMLTILAEATLDDLPNPEILCVPGGWGTRDAMSDERILNWIRAAHETSEWTTSVCTGSLLLGAAGVLRDSTRRATGSSSRRWPSWAPRPTGHRVVEQGKVITAAGVSSGIDMALFLLAKIAGEDYAKTIQLLIEYDPQPPFDAGSPEKASPETVAQLRELAVARAYLEEGLPLAAVGRHLVHDPVAGYEVERLEALAQLARLRVPEVDPVADRAGHARARRAPASAPRRRPRSGRG